MFLAGAILLLALNLRPGATAIGPVLQEMRDGLAMSALHVGLLGAMPGLVFAIVGLAATSIARKCGLTGALVIAAGAIAVGLTARALVGNVPLFFLLTILAFMGMGVGNVLAPPYIRRHFPLQVAVMTTVYTSGLAVGATIPPLVSAPIAEASSWRWSIGLWGISGIVLLAVWVGVWIMQRGATETVTMVRGAATVPIAALLRSRKAVALAVFFGMQSMQAYIQFAWAAQMFRDGGLDPTTAGVMVSVIASIGIPGGLLIPAIVARSRHLTSWVLLFSGLLVAGYLGILYAPTAAPVLWAVSLGLSGMCFPMAISLITARSREVAVTASLSALVQSLGYGFAALGPFLMGVAYDAFGSWHVPVWVLIGTAVILATAGIIATRPGDVDDELVVAKS